MTDDYALKVLENTRDNLLTELNGNPKWGDGTGVYADIHRTENRVDDLKNLAEELEDQLEQVEFAISFLSQPEAFPEKKSDDS